MTLVTGVYIPLEVLSVIEDGYLTSDDEKDHKNIKLLREDKKYFQKDCIREMKAKFTCFNSRVSHLLSGIFSELLGIFSNEHDRLTALTGKIVQLRAAPVSTEPLRRPLLFGKEIKR